MRPSSQNKRTILDVIVKTIAMIYLIVSRFGLDMEFDLLCLLQKKGDCDVATGMNYGVGSFFSWSKFICNSKSHITRNRGPLRLLPSLKVNTFNGCRQASWHLSPLGLAPRFPHGCLNTFNSHGYPHYD
jgi:hypothetical protein